MTHEPILLFNIKETGICWFDEIVKNDEIIKQASMPPNLMLLDKRIDELMNLHNIVIPQPS